MHYPFIQNKMFDIEYLFSKYKSKPAIITETETLTFSDFRKKLLIIRQALEKRHIRPGSNVAFYNENSEIHLLMLLASWLLNFRFIPLNFKTPIDEVLTWTDIDVLVSNGVIKNSNIEAIIHIDHLTRQINAPRVMPNINPVNMGNETSIIFTSGSTGVPSGVVHTVGNYIYSALGTIENLDLNSQDRWLVSLPMYHVGGLLIFVRTFLSGASCILPGDMKQVETAINLHLPTVVSLVPTQLLRFMSSPETLKNLQSSKAILLGGAPSPSWLIDQALEKNLPIIPTYGSTETCAQITAVDLDSPREIFHTSGKVLPYRDMSLGEDSRILVGGQTLFKYYIRKKQKQYPFQNGKFKTSDLGKFDSNGNLIVLGRSDQIFISGGENINPSEIEYHIMSIDHITSAIVVPVPHKEFGFVPWAFVETTQPMDPENISLKLRKHLPAYKIPKKILFLTPEEKQGEMKFKRNILREKAEILSKASSNTQ